MKKLFGIIVLSLFAFALASCDQVETQAVGFEVETLTLEVGETASLALNNPRNISLSELTFASEDEAVVTVTAAGGVVAEGEGITAVTLTYADVIVDFVLVNVYDPDGIAVDGREIVMRVQNNYVQWAYEGDSVWNDLISLFALTGQDGSEIEFNVSETHIQWRYVGAATWTDLLALSAIKGADGQDGQDGLDGLDGVSIVDAYYEEVEYAVEPLEMPRKLVMTLEPGFYDMAIEMLSLADNGFSDGEQDYALWISDSYSVINYFDEYTQLNEFGLYIEYYGYNGIDGLRGNEYLYIEGEIEETLYIWVEAWETDGEDVILSNVSLYVEDWVNDDFYTILLTPRQFTFENIVETYLVIELSDDTYRNILVDNIEDNEPYIIDAFFSRKAIENPYFNASNQVEGTNVDFDGNIVDQQFDDPYATTYEVFYSGYGNDEEPGANPSGYEYYKIYGTTTQDMTFGIVYVQDSEDLPIEYTISVAYNVPDFVLDGLYSLDPIDMTSFVLYAEGEDYEGGTFTLPAGSTNVFITMEVTDARFDNDYDLDFSYYISGTTSSLFGPNPFYLAFTFEPGYEFDNETFVLASGFDGTNEMDIYSEDYTLVLVNAYNEILAYGDDEFYDGSMSNYFDGDGTFRIDFCGGDCPGGELFEFNGIIFETLFIYVIAEEGPNSDFAFFNGIDGEPFMFVSKEEFISDAIFDDYLTFVYSNGRIEEFNYTDMFFQSRNYSELLRYINNQDEVLYDYVVSSGLTELFSKQFELLQALYRFDYQASVLNAYDGYYLGDLDEEEYYFFLQYALFQYTFEVYYLLQDSPMNVGDLAFVDAFENIFFGGGDYITNENLLIETFFELGSYASYYVADVLGIYDINRYDLGIFGPIDEILFELYDEEYLPLISVLEYVNYISTFDESSFYQYTQMFPLTDWDYESSWDRYEYATLNALNNLYFWVDVNFYDDDDGYYFPEFNVSFQEMSGYNLYEDRWANGGDQGIYVEEYDYFITLYGELYIERYFPTIDVSNGVNEFYIYDGTVNNEAGYAEFNVPYGASFPLPTESYFYGEADYLTVDDDGDTRYFVLDGYYVYDYYDDGYYDVSLQHENNTSYWTFDGWYPNPYNFNGWNELYIYADWEEVFLVKYYDTDETTLLKTDIVRYGNNSDAPTNYTIADGYEFVEWQLSNGNTATLTNITSSFSVFAYQQLIEYDIFYNLDGGTNDVSNPSTFNVDDLDVTLAAPTKTGYTFDGWEDVDGNAVTSITTIGDKTLYATWTATIYNITYTLNDGTNALSNPATYTVEDATITFAAPTKTGYTFVKWTYTDESTATEIAAGSTGDVTVIAIFTINQYTLSFDLNYAGSPADPDDITADYNTTQNLPANPTRTGYTFLGWSLEADDVVDVDPTTTTYTIPAYDELFTAVWEIETYTVDFEDFNGTLLDSQEVEYLASATAPADPTREGYTFTGWDVAFDSITGDLTVTAEYRAINYAVTVDIQGQGDATFNVSGRPNIGQTITVAVTPSEGYIVESVTAFFTDDNGIEQAVLVTNNAGEYTITMPAYDITFVVTLAVEILT